MKFIGSLIGRKQPKARRFNYQPVYYDELKERMKERQERIAAELDQQEGHPLQAGQGAARRISDGFAKARRERKDPSVNLTVLVIVLLLVGTVFLYRYVGDYALFALAVFTWSTAPKNINGTKTSKADLEQHACIQLLPDALANQIAAGEVVQRPASVVKELLENSIDAGASDIKLIVRQAGKQLIQVVDNGSGMNEVDARMAFERHATSKIKEQQDLFAIHTLGFRGEALASIAAVAQVELQTRTEAQDLGLALRVEGGQVQAQEPVQCLKGSTLSVGNLFFNVPARRKFLKSDAAEMRHVLDEFHHVALSEPQIHFHLVQDNKEVYNLPPEKLHLRIARLFGNSFKGKLAKVQEATSALNLKGYIGAPELARKKRGFHFMFVNGRFIRHAYLNHAVKAAFDQVLPEEKHPFYVLFLQVDPADVDVNVHPTKTEVKFEDEQSLYALIRAAVQQSLNEHNLLPSIDFDYDEGNASFLRLERCQSTAQPSQNTPQEKQGPASKGHPNRRDPLHRSDSEAYIRNFNHMHHREALFEEERRKWQGDEESPNKLHKRQTGQTPNLPLGPFKRMES